MKTKLAAVALTHTQKRVLYILRREWRAWIEGNSWQSFSALAERIRRPERETRMAVRALAEIGALRYSPMVNDDGEPCGSGYFLTRGWDG